MQITGVAGAPAASSGPNVAAPAVRITNTNELGVSEIHGRYYESSYRKGRFSAANQAAVATTAAFATTYTGIVLYNPPGSIVNLVLERVGVAPILAQTTTLAFGIMTGFSSTALSGVTALTPKSKFVGAGAGVGLAASAATLPIAPTLDTILGYIGTGATTVDQAVNGLVDLGGDIILPPGGYAALYTNAASLAASLIASMQWEEVPV
jgi:hypothetical protein